MAARENQGYLIAIIMLVLFTIILAILTYFAFAQAGAASSQLTKASADLKAANSRMTAYQKQAEIFQALLGYRSIGNLSVSKSDLENTDESDIIQQTSDTLEKFEEDMQRFKKAPAENVEKNYASLINDFFESLMDKHREVTRLHNSVARAEAEMANKIKEKDEQIVQITSERDNMRTAYQNEVARHEETKQKMNQELENAKQENLAVNQKAQREQEAWNRLEAQLRNQLQTKTDRVADLEAKLAKYESTVFDQPDGRVLRVSRSNDTVYLNLGFADNLQLRQTFAVFDAEEQTFERGNEKAVIEVIDLIDSHSAKARIIQSNSVTPVLAEDYVMSSTWDVGYAVPVALAGSFDVDGDGNSDLERLIGLIRQNGGEVVAYHDETGKVIGRINEKTRWLIIGDEPEGDDAGTMATGMSQILSQAEQYVTREIPWREYLNMHGIRLEGRVVPGTGTIQPDRFPERQPPRRSQNGDAFGNN